MFEILANCFLFGISVFYLGTGVYLLGWGFKEFADGWDLWFLVQERRHKRQLELLEKAIELEKASERNESPTDSRCRVSDGASDSGDGEAVPVRAGAPGSLRGILSDLQAAAGELRDGAGADAATAPANE